MKNYDNVHFSTMTIHAGQGKDPSTGAAATPIYQTSTFIFDSVDEPAAIYQKEREGYTYTRGKNPTTDQLEKKIAVMEGAETSIATASGMGAIASVLLTKLSCGDHLITSETLYGGTAILMHNMERFGIEISYIDMSDKEQIKNNIRPNTKMLYVESPANPTLKLADIKFCAEIAHANGALLVIDSTFAPPPIQYPIKLGADISIHSTTKYISGHGDSIGGIISGGSDELYKVRVEGMKCICGTPPSPFNSWLVLRGMKTFSMRIERHCQNAMKVAEYLNNHPYVKRLNYPGLMNHPQHELAKEQMNGFGGVVSFELKDSINGFSGFEACKQLLNNLNVCSIGVSLGDVDTLIEHPASMTHVTFTKDELEKADITETLIRLSVGLEDPEDIINDFEQAFNKM